MSNHFHVNYYSTAVVHHHPITYIVQLTKKTSVVLFLYITNLKKNPFIVSQTSLTLTLPCNIFYEIRAVNKSSYFLTSPSIPPLLPALWGFLLPFPSLFPPFLGVKWSLLFFPLLFLFFIFVFAATLGEDCTNTIFGFGDLIVVCWSCSTTSLLFGRLGLQLKLDAYIMLSGGIVDLD